MTTLSRNLPAFNRSATTGLKALGNASVTGRTALKKSRDEIKQLGKSSKKAYPTADDLSKFLRDIDDPRRAVEVDARAAEDTGRDAPTGYTGMEGLLNYLYYQTGAINQYDEIGHLLHFSIFEVATGPCANYNPGIYKDEVGVPNADGSAATTNVLEANRCVAWLGDSQPDINEPLNLPPYDPAVCPYGSTDTSLCDPAGTLSASVDRKSSKKAKAGGGAGSGDGTDGTTGGDTGTDGGGADDGGTGTDPVIPGVPDVPTTPEAPPSAPGSGSADGNSDILGFLFGN